MSLEGHTIDKVKAVFILSGLRFLKGIIKRSVGDVFISSLLQLFRVSRGLQDLDSATPCMMFQAELVIGVPNANMYAITVA
jgi:hypothetical protein